MMLNLLSHLDSVAYGLTLFLVFLLPFESIRPVFVVRGLQITNLEILLALALLAGLANMVSQRRHLPGRGGLLRLLWPAGALLLVALLSALLAPREQLPAVKSTLRLGAGILLMVVVWSQVQRRKQFTLLVAAIVAGAAVAALFGLLERASLPLLEPLFQLFKERATFVGTEVRISGSFQYATIAAMYWEMALPLALGLAAARDRSRSGRVLALVAALILVTAIVFSLTRAGLIVLFLLVGGLLLLSRTRSRFRPLWPPAGITALYLVGLLFLLGIGNRSFRVRLVTENDLGWFDARYDVPDSLAGTSGEHLSTIVTVTNTGVVDWPADGAYPFVLGYRWINAEKSRFYDLPPDTFPLPADVQPGETVILSPTVAVPLPAGTYLLSWGMYRRDVFPFFGRGVPDGETVVTIRPGAEPIRSPESLPLDPREQQEPGPDIVSRPELWLAAGRMWRDRPVWGYGLNNYRFLYGAYIGRETWDMRTNANNLYIELLADLGVLGLLAAGWLIVTLLWLLWRMRRSIWAVALAGSLAALLIHGFLDYFFEFLGVLLLFWVLAGLAAAHEDGRQQ